MYCCEILSAWLPRSVSTTGGWSVTSTTVATFGATVQGNTDFSFGARFDHGFIRVLSQPKLLCASGEKAEFVAGGEIPIPLITANQITIEWKKFGIVLNITPTADRSGNIGTALTAHAAADGRRASREEEAILKGRIHDASRLPAQGERLEQVA